MITRISSRDARYPIGSGHGSYAIHKDPVYSYAVTLLHDDSGQTGCGLAFTLGWGTWGVWWGICIVTWSAALFALFWGWKKIGRTLPDAAKI